jgi:hypothetical protein
LRKISITIMVIITIAMMAGMASASGVNSLATGGATTGTNGQDIFVTIEATSMSNVGSLQLNIVYDKNVITASTATTGGMTSGSLFASNIDNVAGKVNLGWVSTTGMSGTGTLVTIKFHVVGNRGANSPLNIKLVDITDPKSGHVTTRPKITNGIFNVKDIGSISSITVTSPNGGEKWKHGTTHVLRWKSVGSPGANVKIELLKGTVAKTIVSSAKNNGSYSWKIPASQTPGTNYKIRIISTTNKAYTDTSNKNFNITT